MYMMNLSTGIQRPALCAFWFAAVDCPLLLHEVLDLDIAFCFCFRCRVGASVVKRSCFFVAAETSGKPTGLRPPCFWSRPLPRVCHDYGTRRRLPGSCLQSRNSCKNSCTPAVENKEVHHHHHHHHHRDHHHHHHHHHHHDHHHDHHHHHHHHLN